MKTKFFLIVILCLPVFIVKGQKNVPPFTVENVNVTPPAFTGIENSAKLTTSGKDAYLREYLYKSIELPEEAQKCFAEGTEVVQFVVTSEGKLTDFKIRNSVCPSIDNEIIRALKTTDKMWKPGFQNEVPVDMEKEITLMIIADVSNLKNPGVYFTNMCKENFIKGNELFLDKNNAKKAMKYYDNCVKYLPNETASLMIRGLCKYQLGDKEGATSDWKRINGIGENNMSEFIDKLSNEEGFAEMINTVIKIETNR